MALLICQCWLWVAVWQFFHACPEAQAQQLPLCGDAAGWPHNRFKKGSPVVKHWMLTKYFNQLGPEDMAAANNQKLKHMKRSSAESDPRELQQPHWGEQSLSCLPTSTFPLNTQGLKLLLLFWYAGRGSVWKVSSVCTEHKQFHKAFQHGPTARPDPAPAPRDVVLTLPQSKLHIHVEQFSEILSDWSSE